MNLWKVLGCFLLLTLAGAVVLKGREVAGLREKAHHLGIGAYPGPARDTKPHGQHGVREASRPPLNGADDADLLSKAFNPRLSGEFRAQTIKLLNLSDDKVQRLEAAMRRFRGAAAQDLLKRLKPTVHYSNDGSSHQFYYARARRDRGQAYFDGLTQEFEPVLGTKRSAAFMEELKLNDRAARLAKLDLEIEMIRSPDGTVMVNYQSRSPRTGGVSEFDSKDLPNFEAEFGKLFEVPEAE